MARRRKNRKVRSGLPPLPTPPGKNGTLKQWKDYADKLKERAGVIKKIREARQEAKAPKRRK